MQSQPEIPAKQNDKQASLRSFSNRYSSTQKEPYSYEYTRAKFKAFERYKKIYPVKDKENIYPLSKTPNIGFYIMKGYKQDTRTLRESNQANNQSGKSSDRVITHMLKKYLQRKEQVQLKQQKQLPKIDHSVSVSTYPKSNQTVTYMRHPQKQISTRICTEYDQKEDRLKPMGLREI